MPGCPQGIILDSSLLSEVSPGFGQAVCESFPSFVVGRRSGSRSFGGGGCVGGVASLCGGSSMVWDGGDSL
ncbi:hypothetical protein ACOMHN_021921 [Nucella lapillus]